MKKKVRQYGECLLDLEKILDEMIDDHGCQYGDILWQVFGHLEIHRPDAKEQYVDGSGSPQFYYGVKKE